MSHRVSHHSVCLCVCAVWFCAVFFLLLFHKMVKDTKIFQIFKINVSMKKVEGTTHGAHTFNPRYQEAEVKGSL